MSHNTPTPLDIHAEQITRDLKRLGADAYDLMLPETHALPNVVAADEQIIGIVYGKYWMQSQVLAGRGALVATNNRALLVDKKPLYLKCDELSYNAVGGVTYSRVGPIGIVTLHSKLGDIQVRTFNQSCARIFVQSVEAKLFAIEQEGGEHDYAETKWNLQTHRN